MNLIKSFLISILLVTMSLQSSFAGSLDFNEKDNWIYEETLDQCKDLNNTPSSILRILNENNSKAFLISAGESIYAVFSKDFRNSNEFKAYSQNGYLSQYLTDRLDSLGFVRAVEDCFPDDLSKRRQFVKSMIFADLVGKIPLAFAASMVISAKINFFMFLAKKFPKTFKVLGYSTIGLSLLSLIYSAREAYLKDHLTEEEAKRVQAIEHSLNMENALVENELLQMAENTKAQLLETLKKNPTQANEIANAIQQIDLKIRQLKNSTGH